LDDEQEARSVEMGNSICEHGVVTIGGKLLIECDGEIDGQLWGAGATLASYLLDTSECGGRHLVADWPCVVEVGSGTGVAGLAAALAGASSVLLTDLPQCVGRLDQATELNATALQEAGCVVEAVALPWGDAAAVAEVVGEGAEGGSKFPDIVIGADVLYQHINFDGLLRTLELLARPRSAPVYLATEQRWGRVIALWEESLARSAFFCASTNPLPTPKALPRAVLLQELRLRDTGNPGVAPTDEPA
jgi:hypothetical protein